MGLDKPSRSEDLGSPEEQHLAAQQVHDYFEATEPKRASKPARSEIDVNSKPSSEVVADIPELRKFQELEAGSEHLDFSGNGVEDAEEFVETEYYKDLAAAEKGQHHTTGTGFIKVATESLESFHLEAEDELPPLERTKSRSNPATNEWEPSSEVVIATSGKPPRSEN